jgi:hypothetical protein
MYSKVYNVGRLSFMVEVFSDAGRSHELALTRLPVIPVTDGSYHTEQTCYVYFKEGLDGLATEQGMTVEELIERCIENAGFDSDNFVLAEYIGRDGSSENFTPDTALDGFMEWEIEQALATLEQDGKLLAYLTDQLIEKQLLVD